MNKKKISKIIILIITLALIACLSTTVLADDGTLDLSNSLTGGNNTTGNNTTGNNTTGNSTTVNNTTGNKTVGNNTTGNSTTTNNTSTNTNTSKYEESNIPYAGPAESILMVVAFIVCGIIGVYTFIKLSDYSNI